MALQTRIHELRCVKQVNLDRAYSSIGTLGGGNHFIELDKDDESKDSITLTQYKEAMKGIYSSMVDKSTIDEAPFAYKPMEEIIANIGDTVTIDKIIRPLYDFKAADA